MKLRYILPVATAALAYLTPDTVYAQARGWRFPRPVQKQDTAQVIQKADTATKKDSTQARADTITRRDSAQARPQQRPRVLHNRILSRNPEYSATGDGRLLKKFVHNFNLSPDTRINLDSTFELYAERGGNISYDALGFREGLASVIADLRKDSPLTDKDTASIKYLQGLLGKMKESDRNSVNLLKKAVNDKVIDFETDSLKELVNGWYVFVAKSTKQGNYVGNSIPIIVDVKTPGPIYVQTEPRTPEVVVRPGAERERFVADSIAREKARQDSLAREAGEIFVEIKERQEEHPIREKPKHVRTLEEGLSFGLEVGAGANKEDVAGVAGVFARLPVATKFGLEVYADVHLGNVINESNKTQVTYREKQLIGPETHKLRTDEIKTVSEDEALAEAGAGFLYKVNKALEVGVRAGVVLSDKDETLYRKSTIEFERNMQKLGDTKVITKTKKKNSGKKSHPSFSLGAWYNFAEKWAAGLSVNRVGEQNSGRLNLKYKLF